ncbi:dynein light intermediate chain-domain-containing protein [Phascolomyces articulosus]|uniref:Dynein light intermediate chain-domain-containing protein n=1 Tax=Phascolomyces articulosus TaxID=60185 RepID=A0AAD5PGF0_9FUNG|nr:dynein light intermediate chain-domain-containing protein [Phascolomyces articulosus]
MTENNNIIWSAILKTASSSKRIRTKNVLILGDACSGKSTLAHYLKHQPTTKIKTNHSNTNKSNNPHHQNENKNDKQHPPEQVEEEQASFIRTVASGGYIKSVKQDLDAETTKMLGVGYTSALVHDQNDEAILRLGIYQLGHEQLLSLLDPVLTDDNLFGIIVLDWTKPWTFLESLQRWMTVLKRWSTQVIHNESKVRVKEYIQQEYNSSSNDKNKSDMHDVFTINLGIPIVVVCCKSDAQKMLEEKYGYDEAQLDYIQQTLRCICMKYGAGLFYTSTFYPSTFDTLRTYIAYRSEEQDPSTTITTDNNDKMTMRIPTIQPHYVESSCVTIPAGWDTWEKIKLLEENYQCQEMDKAWEEVYDGKEGGVIKTMALSIYHEAVSEPTLENSDQVLQPSVTSEDEQILYARFFNSSNVIRPPPPPPLSTTFLRELAHREATMPTTSPKENGYTSSSLSSPRRIEIPSVVGGSTTATITTPPAVSVYTTATATSNSSNSVHVNSISYASSNHVTMNNNNHTTALMTYASSTSSTTLPGNHHHLINDIGTTHSNNSTTIPPPSPPSSEILSQFFQKLLYKNMESTTIGATTASMTNHSHSSTTSTIGVGNSNGGGNDRSSRSSATTVNTNNMHNRPPCVNSTT